MQQLKRYIRKSEVFQAIQWNKENQQKVLDFLAENEISFSYHEISSGGDLIIHYNRQTLAVRDGNYICYSNSGDLSICPPELFNIVYEVVDEDSSV